MYVSLNAYVVDTNSFMNILIDLIIVLRFMNSCLLYQYVRHVTPEVPLLRLLVCSQVRQHSAALASNIREHENS